MTKVATRIDAEDLLTEAWANARQGKHDVARACLLRVIERYQEPAVLAAALSDLAVLEAAEGRTARARDGFRESLRLAPDCLVARTNLNIVDGLKRTGGDVTDGNENGSPIRVAVLSFLFNWPARGGGNVHTVELAQFLGKAGYEVRHFYTRNVAWGIGSVDGSLPIDSRALEFCEQEFTATAIQARFRAEVDQFAPDYVIITDCWNMKPHLAEAVHDYPYILRQQALELLCPLNNLRLLADGPAQVRQCALHQLDAPHECRSCVTERQLQSGPLHRAERALAGFGTPGYDERLRRTIRDAQAILVHNPVLQSLYAAHSPNVQVVTWGMDGSRFPWPWQEEPPKLAPPGKSAILMAGVVDELIKGFDVLHAACARLWERRQDFILIATGTPAGQVDAFTHFIGWVSQDDLPAVMRGADVVAVPTIAQDGLSRTSVEAMGVGRAVIASRIGGLPSTVEDGTTGLLCEPGDISDWTDKIIQVLDHPDSRNAMGLAGRRRFETDFLWETVIQRHYRPLLSRRRRPTPLVQFS